MTGSTLVDGSAWTFGEVVTLAVPAAADWWSAYWMYSIGLALRHG